jgi:hypothetical protein
MLALSLALSLSLSLSLYCLLARSLYTHALSQKTKPKKKSFIGTLSSQEPVAD